MKLTIVLPTYGRPQLLNICLESYARQTLPKEQFKILIGDNKPGPETIRIIDSFRGRLDIEYFPHPVNCQLTGNGCMLIDKVRTPFVKVQCDDDVNYPDFLERGLAILEKYPDVNGYVCKGRFVDAQGKIINEFRPILDPLCAPQGDGVVWTQDAIVSASFLASTISMHTGIYRTRPLQCAYEWQYPVWENSTYSGEKMYGALLVESGSVYYDNLYVGGEALWHSQSLTMELGNSYREREFQYTSSLVLRHALQRGIEPLTFACDRLRENPACETVLRDSLKRAMGERYREDPAEWLLYQDEVRREVGFFAIPQYGESLSRRIFMASPFRPGLFRPAAFPAGMRDRPRHALLLGALRGETVREILGILRKEGIRDVFWIHLFAASRLWIDELYSLGVEPGHLGGFEIVGLRSVPAEMRDFAPRLACAYGFYESDDLEGIGTGVAASGFVLKGHLAPLAEGDAPPAAPRRSCLAICTPQLGGISETFIHRHIRDIPGCVVLTGDIFNGFESPVPTLKVPYQNGDHPFPADWDQVIRAFLLQHGVTHLLCEYGCYGTQLLYWNKRNLGLPAYVHFHGGDSSAIYLSQPEWRSYYASLPSLARKVFTGPRSMALRLQETCGLPAGFVCSKRYGVEVPETVERKLPGETVRLVFVGRLTAKKSPEDLLRAFRYALDLYPRLSLDVVGDDGLSFTETDNSRKLKTLIQELGVGEKVTLHGTQTPARSREILESCDIYVQHSVRSTNGDVEGMPIIILEAAARGLPVISTRHEGIVEEVEEGVTGFLVEEHDYQEMGRRIAELARDPHRVVRMGLAGHAKMQADFSIGKEIGTLCRLMDYPEAR